MHTFIGTRSATQGGKAAQNLTFIFLLTAAWFYSSSHSGFSFVSLSLLKFCFCMFLFLDFHHWDTLHHVGIQRHEMALSHLPLLHPCKSSLNCDVDQQLILFPFLEPVAGTAEELATEIPPQDAVDTKLAVCTSVCKIKSLSMSFRDCECMMLTVLGCLCLSICFPNCLTKPECGFKLNRGWFFLCVCSMLPTSSVCVASPL